MEPSDLSLKDLKSFHKGVREKKDCAINNQEKAKAIIVLSMLDEELEKRGYDVEKLFKNYKK
jgi:hypothetical protein